VYRDYRQSLRRDLLYFPPDTGRFALQVRDYDPAQISVNRYPAWLVRGQVLGESPFAVANPYRVDLLHFDA
jgi:hypothetical protein